VPSPVFEPETSSFKVQCSTTELVGACRHIVRKLTWEFPGLSVDKNTDLGIPWLVSADKNTDLGTLVGVCR
jgi:hypothetical protein